MKKNKKKNEKKMAKKCIILPVGSNLSFLGRIQTGEDDDDLRVHWGGGVQVKFELTSKINAKA